MQSLTLDSTLYACSPRARLRKCQSFQLVLERRATWIEWRNGSLSLRPASTRGLHDLPSQRYSHATLRLCSLPSLSLCFCAWFALRQSSVSQRVSATTCRRHITPSVSVNHETSTEISSCESGDTRRLVAISSCEIVPIRPPTATSYVCVY